MLRSASTIALVAASTLSAGAWHDPSKAAPEMDMNYVNGHLRHRREHTKVASAKKKQKYKGSKAAKRASRHGK